MLLRPGRHLPPVTTLTRDNVLFMSRALSSDSSLSCDSPKGQSLETSVHVPVIIFLNRDKDIDRRDSAAALQPHLRYCSGTRCLFLSEKNSARVRRACIVYKRTFPSILCLDTTSIPVNKYAHTQTHTHYRGVKHVETNRNTCLLVICGIFCSRIKLLSGHFCCFYYF